MNKIPVTKVDIDKESIKRSDFIEEYQHKVKTEKLEQDILALIDKDPSIIYTLSTKKLNELIKLYDEDINKLERKIAYLEQKKKTINNEAVPQGNNKEGTVVQPISVDVEKQESIDSLLDLVDKNPDIIYKLPCEKLIKLIELYKQSNAKLDVEINEMKKQLNSKNWG